MAAAAAADPAVTCHICTTALDNTAVALSCGCVYHHHCIAHWVHTRTGNGRDPNCPTDRTIIDVAQAAHVYRCSRIISISLTTLLRSSNKKNKGMLSVHSKQQLKHRLQLGIMSPMEVAQVAKTPEGRIFQLSNVTSLSNLGLWQRSCVLQAQ